jgi:hypothetical protein
MAPKYKVRTRMKNGHKRRSEPLVTLLDIEFLHMLFLAHYFVNQVSYIDECLVSRILDLYIKAGE